MPPPIRRKASLDLISHMLLKSAELSKTMHSTTNGGQATNNLSMCNAPSLYSWWAQLEDTFPPITCINYTCIRESGKAWLIMDQVWRQGCRYLLLGHYITINRSWKLAIKNSTYTIQVDVHTQMTWLKGQSTALAKQFTASPDVSCPLLYLHFAHNWPDSHSKAPGHE